jgi:glycosylphosphatidylinositol transamidase (GPIT) subunit GPI8
MVYMTGHSGTEFFKVQDTQIIYSADIAQAVEYMNMKKLYRKILFMSDTCQGETFYTGFNDEKTPNAIYMTSSKDGQNSHSANWDEKLNIFIGDQFTSELNIYLTWADTGYYNRFFTDSISDFSSRASGAMSSDIGHKSFIPNRGTGKVLLNEFMPPRGGVTVPQSVSNAGMTILPEEK